MHKKPVRANAEINSTIPALITNTHGALTLNTEITSQERSNGENTVVVKKMMEIILYWNVQIMYCNTKFMHMIIRCSLFKCHNAHIILCTYN